MTNIWWDFIAVYPRACGGTPVNLANGTSYVGLSPRLRGNRGHVALLPLSGRSIPAPAGEPKCSSSCWSTSWVYPRACGGTTWLVAGPPPAEGLSPRLRGNLRAGQHRRARHRSIPAPAGEPRWRVLPISNEQVYPRACGGTMSTSSASVVAKGLSPRLRGNPCTIVRYPLYPRSIPAPAGEP